MGPACWALSVAHGPYESLRDGPDISSLRRVDVPGPVERATAARVVVPGRVVVDGLTALAGAGDRLEVAEAVLPLLLDLPGVRAAAVVERAGPDVVVQGSAGYECAAMGPGTRLPLDAGLPVTEAVRTHRLVTRGPGPSWVAAPFRRRGSGGLLLSLDGAPPEDTAPVAALAQALGLALERVRRTEGELADLAVLTAGAAPSVVDAPAAHVVVRTLPLEGAVGGDVLLSVPDGRDGSWLVVADVCGSGLGAALLARSVATAARALAPYSRGPAELLADLERSLRPVVGPGSFVTALVVHLSADGAAVASAGHPPPLLLTAHGAGALDVPPGQPLALETGQAEAYRAVAVELAPDALLLLHTDGLCDREGARGTEPLTLLRDVPLADPATVADRVLAAAQRAGPATDDVALMVVRPGRVGPLPPG